MDRQGEKGRETRIQKRKRAKKGMHNEFQQERKSQEDKARARAIERGGLRGSPRERGTRWFDLDNQLYKRTEC
eukprot:21109-Amorphochlora_amoeboformis.AAC.1